MQLNIHDSTLKRVGFINNNLPNALHYFNDNWHRYLVEGTSTFDFSVNKVNSDYALLTLQNYISFSYDGDDYLFNIINIQQDHYSMQIKCENLNLKLISEEAGPYGNTTRHSIVWYLKNTARITDDIIEIGNNPFTLTDSDPSNPILSFDSSETKLARIISICTSFNAEFKFRTVLKNDGTLQNITIDLYKAGGVGQKRKDVTLFYGKNVIGITSTGDRTSTFFNSTTVTDSNGKYNWLSVEGKYYNSEGKLEFYKDAGSNTAYAPLSRTMFPSQIKANNSDQYTNKNIQTAASSADSLWDYAVSQFKLYAYPQMTYDVVIAVNAVTNSLGNDRKLDIGDTIIVQDTTFDETNGGLILSVRVSEQEISFTNPLNNKITFTNFVRLTSDISADLYGRMKDLVDENTPYRAELETTNGIQFKNGVGSTTLTARIYFGSDSTETVADSYEWSKDGTVVANAQEITVDASGISDKAVYAYQASINGNLVATQSVTITNVNDGIAGKPGTDGKTSYTHVAYGNSSDGTDGFTTIYPNLNLLDGTKDFSGTWTNLSNWFNDGTYQNLTVKSTNGQWGGLYKTCIIKTAGNYIFSAFIKSDGSTSEIHRYVYVNDNYLGGDVIGNGFGWKRDVYTFSNLNAGDVVYIKYENAISNNQKTSVAGYKLEQNIYATPWMPSASEVKTADYPKYRGEYSDFTAASSTDPTKYTWAVIKGNDGSDGKPGNDGNPGKIVSDTEPTTKFKGLTWKYSGVVDMTLGDGTTILAGTEYYWNGTVWALYEINAHNINGDNLSVTNGTFKDGKIESIWGSNGVNGTTTIEGRHLQIYSSDSTTNTENTVALDNQQGYAQVYTDHKTGRAITVQASFQGFFISDSAGPFVRVTPNGISTSSDKAQGSIQIGAGLTLNLERRGNIVECMVSGTINSALSSNTTFKVGIVPVGYRPNKIVNIVVHMASTNNSSHIDVGTDGVCTWWGVSTNSGYPRGTQLWFTDDPTPQ